MDYIDYIDYIYTAFSYALLIPGAIMCLMPVRRHLRVPAKMLCLVLFPSLVLYSLLMPFVEKLIPAITPNTMFLLTIALCFPIYCMVTDLENIKLFYLTLSVMTLLSFGGLAYFMVYAYILNNRIDAPFYDIAMVFQWGTTLFLMCLVFLPFLTKKLAWILEHFHSKSVWNIIWFVPGLITFCNFSMIPEDDKNATIGRIFGLYLLIDFTLLLLFLLFQQMFYLIAKTLIENSEHEKKAQLLKIQACQYQNLLGYMNETSKLRHDFRHTAHTLLSLAQEGDNEKMLQYLMEYNQSLDSFHPHRFCQHIAANAILAYYAGIAKSHDIQTRWKVELPGELPITDVDLCTILGNLLENAIDGSSDATPAQRFINLSVDLTENGELYIVCVNSFDGNAKKSGPTYQSTKKGGNGIGLLSISVTAEKYAGVTRFYHSDREFNSEVMLNLAQAKT